MSKKAKRLEVVRKKILAEKNLPLRRLAAHLVFGAGNPEAKIVFIGEAPGCREDRQGLPFVGAAGRELNALLHSIGLRFEDVYIANVLKCRPPNNRNPSAAEIKAHAPCLIEQIEAIEPKLIVTLGNFATKFIVSGMDVDKMKTIPGIARLHGRLRRLKFKNRALRVLPLYHPAAMLHNPPLRKVIKRDFLKIKKIMP